MKQTLLYIWELAKIFLIALAIVVPIRYFLFQPFIVKGDSMVPNFHSGDYLIIDEISYRLNSPQRGDVVVFKYPKNPSHRFIKRIIGLPGETIEIKDGKIFIYTKNNQTQVLNEEIYLPYAEDNTYGNLQIILGEKEYFVLGDNRAYSSDSRNWGPLPAENIIGKVFVRVFPLAALGKITSPAY
ncbi:signal peptidase I [Patescibacteria group bacterium]|nr:signal peptidase I [Patescibacteria group bacterium]MBU4274510.1 signal peptidase I [Patescibacteria group bacterium]MBU4367415.1 signal peptidase I [Patescibacteria group bacterium]MBU4461735.1 signal peptidase I [Patescibacteria group bacterium]MCG2700119.1 signal peptidase I [Candidatus Parcubacteria bacterium]